MGAVRRAGRHASPVELRGHDDVAGEVAEVQRAAAVVRALRPDLDVVYDAFVNDRRLRPRHYYRVSVTVTSRTGGVASRRELLYLHRSFPRR
jgi:hypothetical protein